MTGSMLYAKRYPLYAVIRSTTVENSLQITPYLKKQSQFPRFFAQKQGSMKKQTQFKANYDNTRTTILFFIVAKPQKRTLYTENTDI